MCKVLEEMCREERKETLSEVVQMLLADGTLTLEKIAEITHLPLEEVKRLQRGHNV